MAEVNQSDVLKFGFLSLKWEGSLSAGGSITCEEWTKRWVVLKKKSSRGAPRLEHFEKQQHVNKSKGKEVIPLVGIAAVTDGGGRPEMNTFEINFSATPTVCHTLLCRTSSETDKCGWQTSIASVFRQQHLPGRERFDDLARQDQRLHVSTRQREKHRVASCALMKERLDSEVFRVTIETTESSNILKLHGDYVMTIVGDSRLLLSPLSSSQNGIEWDLGHLRDFKTLNGNTLIITAGRRSSTGVGTFLFLTKRADYAFTLLKRKTHELAAQSQRQRTHLQSSLHETCTMKQQQLSHFSLSLDATDFYHEVPNEIYQS